MTLDRLHLESDVWNIHHQEQPKAEPRLIETNISLNEYISHMAYRVFLIPTIIVASIESAFERKRGGLASEPNKTWSPNAYANMKQRNLRDQMHNHFSNGILEVYNETNEVNNDRRKI